MFPCPKQFRQLHISCIIFIIPLDWMHIMMRRENYIILVFYIEFSDTGLLRQTCSAFPGNYICSQPLEM